MDRKRAVLGLLVCALGCSSQSSQRTLLVGPDGGADAVGSGGDAGSGSGASGGSAGSGSGGSGAGELGSGGTGELGSGGTGGSDADVPDAASGGSTGSGGTQEVDAAGGSSGSSGTGGSAGMGTGGWFRPPVDCHQSDAFPCDDTTQTLFSCDGDPGNGCKLISGTRYCCSFSCVVRVARIGAYCDNGPPLTVQCSTAEGTPPGPGCELASPGSPLWCCPLDS